jgi:DNA-binding LytR/AlgR family response regulator
MTINSIYPVSIILPFSDYHQAVLLSDIVSIRGVGNYTEFRFVNGRTLLTSITLKRYEERLAQAGQFFRTSKSVIVNTKFVASFEGGLCACVKLYDGRRFQMSRRRVLGFREWFDASSFSQIPTIY